MALGLTVLADDFLSDWRTGKNTEHSMVALMRQSIFSRLAGYEDTNDAERLSVNPTMRHVVGVQFTGGTVSKMEKARIYRANGPARAGEATASVTKAFI